MVGVDTFSTPKKVFEMEEELFFSALLTLFSPKGLLNFLFLKASNVLQHFWREREKKSLSSVHNVVLDNEDICILTRNDAFLFEM